MKTLLKKSKINQSRLRSVLLKIVSNDISNLSEPCYSPPLKNTYYILLKETGLNNSDIKEFARSIYIDTKAEGSGFVLAKEPGTVILLFIMWYALNKNDRKLYNIAMLYHMIRQYAHTMKRHFKQFCNPETFAYALETLTKTHLFVREKTIANSLMYLAKEMEKKYTNYIKKFDKDQVINFVYASRHRISQSVKSFAENYYRAWKQGKSLKTIDEEPDEEGNVKQIAVQERGKKVIDSIVEDITVYRTFDIKAGIEAQKISRVSRNISDNINKELANTKYSDDVKLVLQLFIKEINEKRTICSRQFYIYVKRLMSVKKTRKKIYFKKQTTELLTKIFRNNRKLKNINSYSSQLQYSFGLYLAYYLTLTLRNKVC